MFDEDLSKFPTETPRSPALLPGLKIWRSIFHTGFWFPLTFVGVFGLIPMSMMLTSPGARLSLGHSKTSVGTVLEATIDRWTRRAEITYKFRVDENQEYRATRNVTVESPYAGLVSGDSVPIKFLVAEPSVNNIVDDREWARDNLFPSFIIPFILMLFLIGPTSIPRFAQLLKDRRIFRKGQLTNASVVFVQPRRVLFWIGWSGLYSAVVYVAYQLDSDDHAEAKVVCRNEWLLNQLEPGTSVHIAYLPNRPSRAVLLENYVR